VQVSAKLDYAVRAMLELAAVAPERMTRDALAEAQHIPAKYLESILASLRHAGLVRSHRGPDGGFALAMAPESIGIGTIARAVEGPLTLVQGTRPESVHYEGNVETLASLWVAVRAALRSVLDAVTLADLLAGSLPDEVAELLTEGDAWSPR
jgi:Rrf2 family protein